MSLERFKLLSPKAKKLSLAAFFGLASISVLWINRPRAVHPIPPIFPAITQGDTDLVRKAVAHDRSLVKSVDLDGNTALHIAALLGNVEIATALLASGADPNALNFRGESPLTSTLYAPKNSPELVRLLLKSGADPRQHLARSTSALHVAARTVSIDPAVPAMLVLEPAQLKLRDDAGKTPIDLAHDFKNARFLAGVSQLTARN